MDAAAAAASAATAAASAAATAAAAAAATVAVSAHFFPVMEINKTCKFFWVNKSNFAILRPMEELEV